MGTIKQGILGGFNGKVGTVVGASWKGISYMRGIAQSVRNPKTEAQVKQRNFFTELNELASQLSAEQIRCLFPTSVGKMSHRNALVKQLAECATETDGVKSIDFAEIGSLGNASQANIPDVSATVSGTNLVITIPTGDIYAEQHAQEYPVFMVINQTKKTIAMVNAAAPFGTAAHTFALAQFGESTDTFRAVMYNSGSKMTIHGFGTMGIVERPPRK